MPADTTPDITPDASPLPALTATSFPALALLYAALFGAFGTVTPFMPSLLAERGLDPAAIATVFAAGTLMRIGFGPLVGALADRLGTRAVLAAAALGAGTIGLFYLPAAGFAALIAVSMAHATAISGLNPLADALALAGSLRDRSYSYGTVRGLGSATYALMTFASGLLVAGAGLSSIILLSSALFLLMLPALPALPPVSPAVPPALAERSDGRVGAGDGDAGEPGGRTGPGLVEALTGALHAPAFRGALVVAALVIGSQSMSDTFAVIHWRAAGLGDAAVSTLLAEAVCSEIVVFLVIGPPLVRRLGPARCAALSAVAGIVRWSVFASTTAAAALAVSELLQGLTFALMHLAVMSVIASAVPPRHAATAQTLYGTLSLGIASAVVTEASGWIFAAFAGRGFLFMAGLCALALPLTPRLRTAG